MFLSRQSISHQLLLYVLMIYFGVTMMVTAVHFYFEFDHQKKLLKEELQTLSSATKRAITNAVWDMNQNQLIAEVNGIIQIPIIKAIEIEDKNGNLLLDRISENCDTCKNNSFNVTTDIGRLMFDKEIYLGRLTLYSDLGVVLERVKINFGFILFNAILKSTLLVLLFIFAFRKYLTKPLTHIVSQIERIDLNRLEHVQIQYDSQNENELTLLKDSVNQMLKKLDDQVDEIKQNEMLLQEQNKMASMGEMIGVISHQWKQPLSAIILITDVLKDHIAFENNDKEEMYKFLDKMKQQTYHMENTINDFRNFYKPSRQKEYFKACEMANEVYRLNEARFSEMNVTFTLHDHECIDSYGLPNEFKQVLMNLYSNACDALKTQAPTERKIDVLIERSEQSSIMRIRDTGGGIPEELLPDKLFERNISTKGEAGTGIGLQISKTIIEEKFQGRLWAHNVEGGAEFVIELPASEHESVPN